MYVLFASSEPLPVPLLSLLLLLSGLPPVLRVVSGGLLAAVVEAAACVGLLVADVLCVLAFVDCLLTGFWDLGHHTNQLLEEHRYELLNTDPRENTGCPSLITTKLPQSPSPVCSHSVQPHAITYD